MHLLITTAHRLDSEALGYALRHELPDDLVDDVTLLAPTVLEAPSAPPETAVHMARGGRAGSVRDGAAAGDALVGAGRGADRRTA